MTKALIKSIEEAVAYEEAVEYAEEVRQQYLPDCNCYACSSHRQFNEEYVRQEVEESAQHAAIDEIEMAMEEK